MTLIVFWNVTLGQKLSTRLGKPFKCLLSNLKIISSAKDYSTDKRAAIAQNWTSADGSNPILGYCRTNVGALFIISHSQKSNASVFVAEY